jgi:hypothetical protein
MASSIRTDRMRGFEKVNQAQYISDYRFTGHDIKIEMTRCIHFYLHTICETDPVVQCYLQLALDCLSSVAVILNPRCNICSVSSQPRSLSFDRLQTLC